MEGKCDSAADTAGGAKKSLMEGDCDAVATQNEKVVTYNDDAMRY